MVGIPGLSIRWLRVRIPSASFQIAVFIAPSSLARKKRARTTLTDCLSQTLYRLPQVCLAEEDVPLPVEGWMATRGFTGYPVFLSRATALLSDGLSRWVLSIHNCS